MMTRKRWIWFWLCLCWSVELVAQPDVRKLVGSPHDLSSSGRDDACGFCHTPHGVQAQVPLWSQGLSKATYTIYQSSSLQANIGQPTGSSKLCLSCHDGTVASPIANGAGVPWAFFRPGQANLGTDLSDDHPISFFYSDSLSARDPQIRPASTLPRHLKLDAGMELQCTTCHDPHNNQHGDFLTMSNERSLMCVSCHQLQGWTGSVHEGSGASVTGSHNAYLVNGPYSTVEQYACLACHRPHSADQGERLLHYQQDEETCLSCHDGTVAQTNIKAALVLPSRHDVMRYRDLHDLKEMPLSMPRHVECQDCHNPHAIQSVGAQAPVISGALQGVSAVSASGVQMEQANYEYEVCFKCHADNPDRLESRLTRVITQSNTRLEFDPAGPSFHPVVAQGTNRHVPSLLAPMTVSSLIYCTDCHSSGGSTTVKGPHGSMYTPLLKYNYSTDDFTAESEFAYALCYHCHSRNSLLSNESFPAHRRHIDDRIPCSACHDAHGIASAQGNTTNHSHLINFDTRIVKKNPDTGLLEFQDQGIFRGSCSLECHGEKHTAQEY